MRLSWSNAVWLWTLLPLALLGILAAVYRIRDSRRPSRLSHPSRPSHPPKT